MIEKLKTLYWFMKRPGYWAHALALVIRKALPDHDSPEPRAKARNWAAERAIAVPEALAAIGLADMPPRLDPALLEEGNDLAKQSAVTMGGAGDLDLLYAAVRLSGATSVVETGVAYGWSSLAILSALEDRDDGRLVSVDMPYPKMGNEQFVGVVVPRRFRTKWTLVRQPDRYGIKKALRILSDSIDLCHYDSDKSWWGRQYAYPILWKALKPGGVFISDDIQDNFAFAEFVKSKNVAYAITESAGKYVGIARKS